MQQLTNAEEQLMEHLWKLEKAFMKIYSKISRTNQTTTVATLLKRMIDKDFVPTLSLVTPEYYPLVPKAISHVNGLIKNFFNDSASQFASFFTNETNLSERN
jgi:predicted transcriptional regulator